MIDEVLEKLSEVSEDETAILIVKRRKCCECIISKVGLYSLATSVGIPVEWLAEANI